MALQVLELRPIPNAEKYEARWNLQEAMNSESFHSNVGHLLSGCGRNFHIFRASLPNDKLKSCLGSCRGIIQQYKEQHISWIKLIQTRSSFVLRLNSSF